MRVGPLLRFAAAGLTLLGTACAGEPAAFDAGPGAFFGSSPGRGIPHYPTDDVDLLIVVDDRPEAEAAREEAARALPRLVRAILEGDDEVTGARSVQVGLIRSDVGADGTAYPSCPAREGYDGVLQPLLPGDSGGCGTDGPRLASWTAETPDAQIEASLGCTIRAARDGCLFPRPYEAVGRALGTLETSFDVLPPYSGHRDGINAGFVRDGPLLVVFVTQADDCSDKLGSVYARDTPGYVGAPGEERCVLNPYSQAGFSLLELWRPRWRFGARRLLVGLLGGVPQYYFGYGAESLARLAERAEMQPVVVDGRVEPVCTGDTVSASPAPRLLQYAVRSDPGAVVRSICLPGLAGAMDDLAARVRHARDRCIPEETVAILDHCYLIEVRDRHGPPCEPWRGLSLHSESTNEGSRYCRIPRLFGPGFGSATGWYLDTTSEEARVACGSRAPAILRTVGFELAPGAGLRLECRDVPCETDADCAGVQPEPWDREVTCRSRCSG